jgi:hypothetical protein
MRVEVDERRLSGMVALRKMRLQELSRIGEGYPHISIENEACMRIAEVSRRRLAREYRETGPPRHERGRIATKGSRLHDLVEADSSHQVDKQLLPTRLAVEGRGFGQLPAKRVPNALTGTEPPLADNSRGGASDGAW